MYAKILSLEQNEEIDLVDNARVELLVSAISDARH